MCLVSCCQPTTQCNSGQETEDSLCRLIAFTGSGVATRARTTCCSDLDRMHELYFSSAHRRGIRSGADRHGQTPWLLSPTCCGQLLFGDREMRIDFSLGERQKQQIGILQPLRRDDCLRAIVAEGYQVTTATNDGVPMGVRLWGEPLGRIFRVGGLGGIYSLSVVTMVALAWRGWGS